MARQVEPEILIETYVRNRPGLTAEQAVFVERLLRDDPAARAMRDFFVAFHRELESVSREVPEGVAQFAERLFRVRPIALSRARATMPPGPTVLAAHTAPLPLRARHRLLVALSGRPGDPVVRLLEDRDVGTIRAYVIGLERLPAVLSVPALRQAVAVDEYGRAELQRPHEAVEWEELTALLHPAAEHREFEGPGDAVMDGVQVRYSHEGAGATVRFDGPASYALVSDAPGLRVERFAGTAARADLAYRPRAVSVWICP